MAWKFAENLPDMSFFPCKVESDIRVRESNELLEYVAVYVDDLAFVLRDPSSFFRLLEDKYKYKLKGTTSYARRQGNTLKRW